MLLRRPFSSRLVTQPENVAAARDPTAATAFSLGSIGAVAFESGAESPPLRNSGSHVNAARGDDVSPQAAVVNGGAPALLGHHHSSSIYKHHRGSFRSPWVVVVGGTPMKPLLF